MNKSNFFSSNNFTIFVIFLILFSLVFMIIGKNASLHYSVMDLGISTHTLFGVNDLKEYSRMFFGHIQPYSYFYAKIWGIFFKSSLSILFLQLFFLILPIFWIYKKYSIVSVFAYLLYFPLWFNALFDFHIDHLSIPILFGFFFATLNNKYLWAALFAIALGFVKEVFILQTIMCGFFIILHSHKGLILNTRAMSIGLLTIFFGVWYFIIALKYASIGSSEFQSFNEINIGFNNEAFSWMGSSISEVIIYIASNALEIIVDILETPKKVIYLIALFGALGFVSFLSPGPLIIALPILGLSLLSSYEGYYGLGHHYTAGIIAPMIIAFSEGLPKALIIWQKFGFNAKWFKYILMIGLLFSHILLSPSPVSRLFWSDKIWSYNYHAYIPTERDEMIKKALSDFIPTSSEIVLSVQNTLTFDSLMKRRHILLFPDGVMSEKLSPVFSKGFQIGNLRWIGVRADYVILDHKRPWFIRDQGCEWLYNECKDKKAESEYLRWVDKSRKSMSVIFEEDGFLILRRDLGKE